LKERVAEMPTKHSNRRVLLCLAIGLLASTFGTTQVEASTSPSPSPSASSSGSSSAASGVPAQDPKVVTFGVQTATAKEVDTRGLFSYGATPGAQFVDHVAFINYSVNPIDITVYPSDAYNTADDGFALLTADERSKDAGSWIRLGINGNKLHLDGRTSKGPFIRILKVTLSVPSNANPGDHTGGIVASYQGLATTTQGDKIKLNQRVASRVLIRVSGPLHPKLEIQGMTAKWDGPWTPFGSGHVDVSYRIYNSGNVRLAGQQQLSIKGWAGSSVAKPGDFALLLPDNTVNTRITVKRVFPGFRLKVTAKVQPLAAAGDPPILAHMATATVIVWAIPWTGIACVLLVLLAAWGYRQRRRRKRLPPKEPPAASPPREPVSSGGAR
jgi:hypothetical protein